MHHDTIFGRKVLENGIAEAIGDASPAGDESASLSQTPDHATATANRDTRVGSSSVEPLFTLGISLDGKEERTLPYYTGQVSLSPSTARSRDGDRLGF